MYGTAQSAQLSMKRSSQTLSTSDASSVDLLVDSGEKQVEQARDTVDVPRRVPHGAWQPVRDRRHRAHAGAPVTAGLVEGTSSS